MEKNPSLGIPRLNNWLQTYVHENCSQKLRHFSTVVSQKPVDGHRVQEFVAPFSVSDAIDICMLM